MGKNVSFDKAAYMKDIRNSVFNEMQGFSQTTVEAIQASFSNVEVREIDSKYKAEMLNSVQSSSFATSDMIVTSIGMGGGAEQNQSFRAVYYEYGTGESMEPPSNWSPSSDHTWNTARHGKKIYYRPEGNWKDLGGNTHTSHYKGAPREMLNKKGTHGEEIEPKHFFRDALLGSLKMLDETVLRAVRKVPISAYIVIRSIRKRM